MERKRYAREFKLEAVRLVKERGVSVAQASRDLGVHANVLGGFKRSSQHRLVFIDKAARQAPPPAFSSPVSFSVGH